MTVRVLATLFLALASTVVAALPSQASLPALAAASGGADASLLDARVRRATRDDVALSWRRGCPVHFRKLRVISMNHRDFEGGVSRGEIVVHKAVASELIGIFADLYRRGFLIELMRPVDEYGASDARSMAANNTSAFNCRGLTLDPSRFSRHSWGDALDINPVQNPFVDGDVFYPPAGSAYVDRSRSRPGLLRSRSAEVRAFTSRDWRWGGTWTAPDYQHFSKIRPDEPGVM